MGFCESFAQCVLVTFNVIFVGTGLFVLGVGIFLKADPDLLNIQHVIELNSSDKYISTAAFILIGFGCFVLLVGAFGFIGALKKIKFFLALYIGCLVLVFIGEFSAGITAAVYKGKVDDTLKGILEQSLEEYDSRNKTSEIINKGWDGVQKLLQCCGVNNYTDYKTLNVNLPDNEVIAPSCCSDTSKCQAEARTKPKEPKYFYPGGCYDALEDKIKSHITLLIGVGVGVAMFQLLGIFLACCVWKREDEYV